MFNKLSSQCEIQGQKITVETGHLARQADASVVVSHQSNRVLVTVVSAKEPSDVDFFPLTVNYQEQFYAVGRIPGGFLKRESRPSPEEVLKARLIDRPIRPCFPENYKNETQVVALVLSSDGLFPSEILAGIGVSTALHISDIPFNNPVGFLKVVLKDGKTIFNPTTEIVDTDLQMIVAGTPKGLMMVEGEGQFVSEKLVLDTLKSAHQSMNSIFEMQDDLRKKVGSKVKRSIPTIERDQQFETQVSEFIKEDLTKALQQKDKIQRYELFRQLKIKALDHFVKEGSDQTSTVLKVYDEEKYKMARNMIVDQSCRIDGRKTQDIRPISCEVNVLDRVHGSALFTRGETQVLGTVTLGATDDEKIMDDLWRSDRKSFYLHYNFPPFCVGEVGRFGGQSRREIGHGFLAEKALKYAMPNHEKFPYTVRIVGQVLESNGSSSMGTVCSSMMALLAAGVPVKDTVAGIAMGLIKDKDKTIILSDILGDEDHLGDMDFKVAGSDRGITALQMDLKIDSIDFQTIEQALKQALAGRIHILQEMKKCISQVQEMSIYAPRIQQVRIPPSKIREVIGPGGKTIHLIMGETDSKIDIKDDGLVSVSSASQQGLDKALNMINEICEEAEEGKVYDGVVVGIRDFGAFVEILPKTSGLLHISQISHKRVHKVSDALKQGDKIKVKVLNIDSEGKIRLSAKALDQMPVNQRLRSDESAKDSKNSFKN